MEQIPYFWSKWHLWSKAPLTVGGKRYLFAGSHGTKAAAEREATEIRKMRHPSGGNRLVRMHKWGTGRFTIYSLYVH